MDELKPIPLTSKITSAQPMTGIVYWAGAGNNNAPIQLEFSYIYYDEIVSERDVFNWAPLEKILNDIQSRSHQAVIRFADISGNRRSTSVPAYIKALSDYQETTELVDNKKIDLSDWSNSEWKRFIIDFYTKFAAKYDKDPRIAFVQTGFGIWSEYHLTPIVPTLGKNFPDKAFQSEFSRHLGDCLKETCWLISLDAHEKARTPFASDSELLGLPFGIFDDSFLDENYFKRKESRWSVFGADRWKTVPIGGEFANEVRERKGLYSKPPYEISFAALSSKLHSTFILGSPEYCEKKCGTKNAVMRPFSNDVVRESGKKFGYQFSLLKFEANSVKSIIEIQNIGVAPIYYDAFVAVNGVRASRTLKWLLPYEKRTFEINSGGSNPTVTIESDRLIKGQKIEFEANLK